jgi:DNA-binding transcriptional LysR family regulator
VNWVAIGRAATMKITWLEDFLALVDSGNFSRAAEARGTAQPAFSRHIQGLEDWAGTALFERERRPVSLTAAGRLLRPSAESIISQLNQVRDGIRQEAAAAHTLKFAATHTLSMFFFPMWFRSVEGTPEVVNISLQSNHMDTCAKALIQGECQFLICFTHPSAPLGFDPEAYESKVIGHERLIPVCAPDESGQPLFPLPATAQAPIRHLVFSPASALGAVIQSMLKKKPQPLFLQESFESPLASALRSMAEDRGGVAWVPEMLVRASLASKALVAAGDRTWFIPVEIRVFRTRNTVPKTAEAFWQSVAEIPAKNGDIHI